MLRLRGRPLGVSVRVSVGGVLGEQLGQGHLLPGAGVFRRWLSQDLQGALGGAVHVEGSWLAWGLCRGA